MSICLVIRISTCDQIPFVVPTKGNTCLFIVPGLFHYVRKSWDKEEVCVEQSTHRQVSESLHVAESLLSEAQRYKKFSKCIGTEVQEVCLNVVTLLFINKVSARTPRETVKQLSVYRRNGCFCFQGGSGWLVWVIVVRSKVGAVWVIIVQPNALWCCRHDTLSLVGWTQPQRANGRTV